MTRARAGGWSRRVLQAGLLFAAVTARGRAPECSPALGRQLPTFTVADVTGQRHGSGELVGRPALVLVMTDSDADVSMRAWSAAADRRLRAGVRRVQFVALDLAVIIPTDLARSIARGRSPEPTWRDTWLGRDGAFRVALGLPESETPWAIVLDADGRVTAMVHAEVTSPEAERIWDTLAP